MPKKIFFILISIVLLPLIPLSWLGWRMVQHEQQIIEQQLQALTIDQLKAIDGTIQVYFNSIQKNLIDTVPKLINEPNLLQNYARKMPIVSQVFIISPDGKRIYPAVNKPLNQHEQQFIERTSTIWQDPKIFYTTLNNNAEPFISSNREYEIPNSGWYVWYWGTEFNYIFWWRDQSQRLIGFELDPVRLLSELISRLPDTQNDNQEKRIRLVNSNHAIIYQWGNYEPKNQEQRLSTLQLSYPFGSWKLEYFSPSASHGKAFNWFTLLAGLSAFIIALIGLAVYLYREHTRESRQALQRVSFVNQVSHELKTPLTNIRMYAELLEDEVVKTDDKVSKYLNVIITESQRLSRLIANVLNFSGLQKGKLSLHAQTGNIDKIIEHCIEIFRPAFSSKAVEIKFNANASNPVQIDAAILEQILNNLFSNVEKYGTSGKLLEISSWQKKETTFIRIRDFGPGIPQREREKIFEPFYRISSKLSDGVSGTGIGLSLSRDLARMHGGDIQLLPSESGANFEIFLHTPSIKDI